MKLNKLIKKIANYNKLDILDYDGLRLFPIDVVRNFEIKDLKKYKVKHVIAFTQEPGTITIYVEKIKN